jgi:non-ribosomal peptide synthetase component F
MNSDRAESEKSSGALLSGAERRRVLVEWNATAVAYPPDVRLHDLFAQQVARTPDAVALVFGKEQLSYSELDARAAQIASVLRAGGVGPDTLVGVCMERSLEMVVALFAILQAGGAYVPLDPDYPPDRLSFMLEDAAVPVLLTQRKLASQLPAHRRARDLPRCGRA